MCKQLSVCSNARESSFFFNHDVPFGCPAVRDVSDNMIFTVS